MGNKIKKKLPILFCLTLRLKHYLYLPPTIISNLPYRTSATSTKLRNNFMFKNKLNIYLFLLFATIMFTDSWPLSIIHYSRSGSEGIRRKKP